MDGNFFNKLNGSQNDVHYLNKEFPSSHVSEKDHLFGKICALLKETITLKFLEIVNQSS
jgi:hypothetical protein